MDDQFSTTPEPFGAAAAPKRQLETTQDVSREKRIEELRKQVEEGTYSVDALELSRRLIEHHTKSS